MSNEWVKFLLACMAVLAVVIFGTSGIKIPDSGQTASVIDAVPADSASTDSAPAESIPTEPALAEPVPADSVPTDATSTDSVPAEQVPAELAPVEPEPAPAVEPAPAEPTGASIFQDILQVLLPPLSIENPAPIPAAPKGVSNLKIFVLTQDALESTVNKWFTVQQNIVVDELNVQDYGGGGYLVVINYHTGGAGNSSTRLKIIEGENSEADAQAFLSSLGASQTVRSVAATMGSYSGSQTTVTVPIIFIVYE